MKDILELDSIDFFWLILFVVIALPTTYLGAVIVGGNPVAVCLLIVLLTAATGLLLVGLAKWRMWFQKLMLLLIIGSSWMLLAGSTWSYFRNFC